MERFAIKGHICYSQDKDTIQTLENGYIIVENGVSMGVYSELPENFREIPCHDYGNKIIIPGLIDLHVHAPQYPRRGLGMDLELIEWLNEHIFSEEAKYADLDYVRKSYQIFAEDLLQSATTRACVFGTIHSEATLVLMRELEKTGLCAFVGKVNMDRNSPDSLREESAEKSTKATIKWIEKSNEFSNVKPILTPRFIPTCSDELMARLACLQREYDLPMQSHLSENLKEIDWVKELNPNAKFYGDAYNMYELFGNDCPTIMAHCVYSCEDEIEMMDKQGVFIAHCPESNANLSSGIAPVRKYLDRGMHVGIGTDVAGGTTLSMFRAMAMAVQCSKLRWRLVDRGLNPLKVEEVFYMATKGGGEFFGKVGSFEPGYEFDAVILEDKSLRHPQDLSVQERLERMVCLANNNQVVEKYVKGKRVLNP